MQLMHLCSSVILRPMWCSYGCFVTCEVYSTLQSMQSYNCINNMVHAVIGPHGQKNAKKCQKLHCSLMQFGFKDYATYAADAVCGFGNYAAYAVQFSGSVLVSSPIKLLQCSPCSLCTFFNTHYLCSIIT